ncbi:hypothetical protein LQ318_01905 [Aliifodinibius salicampi]|uniref:Flippase-like domain-containing protein n=1 Tax=Fodinibius salicampi TaxID=1920655 RepID=A0ABT3PUW7_9BACT|nr:hypothetical protein [Fodinibius salicampi]MCW9711645.1 hypothetical protein [Fodinibius salicampi]
MSFSSLTGKITEFFKTERGKLILKWSQHLINVGVLVWLIYELNKIGWLKVWQSFPSQPLFYILFLFLFFQLPLFEVLIYRLTWKFDSLRSIPVFLVKRVYNKDVLGYSGEFYFFAWAKNTLDLSGSEIFKIIKDNNIISSVASTLLSIALLSIFLFTDQIKIMEWIANQNQMYFIGGGLFLVLIIFIFVKFRHYVISMPIKTAYQIFGIQMVRLLLVQTVNLLMYIIVLPDIPLYIWFTYLAIEIILSRIPFLPNRDLIFASISISIAGDLAVAEESIAGIMLAKSALNKIGNVAAFGLSNLSKQSDVVPEPQKNMETLSDFKDSNE